MDLRPTLPVEAAEVKAFLTRNLPPPPGVIPWWTEMHNVKAFVDYGHGLSLKDGGILVGWLGWASYEANDGPGYLSIQVLAVAEGFRDRGHGTQLVNAVIAIARKLCGSRVEVRTLHHFRARQFYKKLGFRLLLEDRKRAVMTFELLAVGGKLSKKVCRNCINTHSVRNKEDENGFTMESHWHRWIEKRDGYVWRHRSSVYCPAKFARPPHGAEWVAWRIRNGIPAWCPYAAEHLVSQRACARPSDEPSESIEKKLAPPIE